MNKPNRITNREKTETITAKEFDRRFDAGEDVSQFMDLAKAKRPGRGIQRVNVALPKAFLAEIDREAARVGVPRQAWIKTALASILRRT
jgi:predicted DNA binding CopG/RHH family protein